MSIGSVRTSIALAFAAGTMAIVGFGPQAEAATVNLTGSTGGATDSYGTGISQNNVVNAGSSFGNYLRDSTSTTLSNWYTQGAVNSTIANYNVTWYFAGSEAADHDTISISSGALTFNKPAGTNYNSNNGANTAYSSLTPLGTVSGSGIGAISFTLSDITSGGSVSNGTASQTKFIDVYVNPMCGSSICGSSLAGLTYWAVTTTATDWFALGYNDTGSSDSDYDDLMFVGHISAVPLPAALPLFATGLGALGLLGWRRKRKAAAIAA